MSHLLASPNSKRLVVALSKEHIVPRPLIDVELGVEPEQQRFPSPVKIVAHF